MTPYDTPIYTLRWDWVWICWIFQLLKSIKTWITPHLLTHWQPLVCFQVDHPRSSWGKQCSAVRELKVWEQLQCCHDVTHTVSTNHHQHLVSGLVEDSWSSWSCSSSHYSHACGLTPVWTLGHSWHIYFFNVLQIKVLLFRKRIHACDMNLHICTLPNMKTLFTSKWKLTLLVNMFKMWRFNACIYDDELIFSQL